MRWISVLTVLLVLAGAVGAEEKALLGKWAFKEAAVAVSFTFKDDGTVVVGLQESGKEAKTKTAKYKVDGDKLTVESTEKGSMTYTFAVKGDRLTLKGGDLPADGVTLTKEAAAFKMPGPAGVEWDLTDLEKHFRIVRVDYDELKQVFTFVVEAKADHSYVRYACKILDGDGVRIESGHAVFTPPNPSKGDRAKASLMVFGKTIKEMKKVVLAKE